MASTPDKGIVSGSGSIASATVSTPVTPSASTPVSTLVTPSASTPVSTVVTPSASTPVSTLATPSASTPVSTVVTPSASTPVSTLATPSASTPVSTLVMPSASTPFKPIASTPVKLSASTPVKLSAITPVKPSASTPVKPSTSTPVKPSASTPAKPSAYQSSPVAISEHSEKSSLEQLTTGIESFCQQVDTQLRATLYSQSIGDGPDVQKTLQAMQRAVKEFTKQSVQLGKDAMLKNNAQTQKIAFLQQHINYLLTEKADLSLQKINLERKLQQAQERAEVLEQELVMKQTDGDFSGDEDLCEPPEKKKAQ